MTKRTLLLCLIGIGLAYFILRSDDQKNEQISNLLSEVMKKKTKIHQVDFEKLQLDGRKVVGLTPGKEKEQLGKLQVMNSPSPEWEEGLKKNLQAQGGNSIKEISLKKRDSFVWVHEGAPLFVESVFVTLKGQDNQLINFRVLVDAQTGKILKNWDQPVVDPMDPRTNFKIKVDPRYHSEN